MTRVYHPKFAHIYRDVANPGDWEAAGWRLSEPMPAEPDPGQATLPYIWTSAVDEATDRASAPDTDTPEEP